MRDKELPYLVSEEFLPVNKKENPKGNRRHEPATDSQRKAQQISAQPHPVGRRRENSSELSFIALRLARIT